MEVEIYDSAAFLTDDKKHSERQCVDLKGRWITEGFNISSANENSDLPRISEIFPIFKGDHQVQWQPSYTNTNCLRLRHFNGAALRHCLLSRDRGIMMSGDSTNREVWEYIATNMFGYPSIDSTMTSPQHKCDADRGYGCFSCLNGCKSKDFKELSFSATHWMDWEIPLLVNESGSELDYNFKTPMQGPRISFTWKPDFFSIEEISRFETATTVEGAKWDAVLVNKGVHLAKELSSLEMFENQNTWNVMVATQAQKLADHLRSIFASSRTLLFWRETYYNHKVSIIEDFLDHQRSITHDIFEEAGFIILPGFDITSPDSSVIRGDGIHQHESVRSLIIDMILSHIC